MQKSSLSKTKIIVEKSYFEIKTKSILRKVLLTGDSVAQLVVRLLSKQPIHVQIPIEEIVFLSTYLSSLRILGTEFG